MKTLKKIIAAATMLALTAMPALAADTDQTSLSLTVSAGALSVVSDVSAALAGVTVDVNDQDTYTGSGLGNDSGDIAVNCSDTRGENLPSGWSATATVTDLTNASSDVIAVTNFSKNFSAITVVSGDGSVVSAGSDAVLTTSGGGVSDSFTVMSAGAGTAGQGEGQGEFSLDMGLDLVVPANQQAGAYSGTVDLSII